MKVNVTVCIDDKLISEIDKKAVNDGRSRSNMVEIMLRKQLQKESKSNN